MGKLVFLVIVLGCLCVNNIVNKMAAEQMDNTELRKEMSKKPAKGNASLIKYVAFGATIAAELMIGSGSALESSRLLGCWTV